MSGRGRSELRVLVKFLFLGQPPFVEALCKTVPHLWRPGVPATTAWYEGEWRIYREPKAVLRKKLQEGDLFIPRSYEAVAKLTALGLPTGHSEVMLSAVYEDWPTFIMPYWLLLRAEITKRDLMRDEVYLTDVVPKVVSRERRRAEQARAAASVGIQSETPGAKPDPANAEGDKLTVDRSKKETQPQTKTPRLPKGEPYLKRWVATWRAIKGEVERGNNKPKDLNGFLARHDDTIYLQFEAQTMRDIIAAGAAGLLDVSENP